MNGYGESYYLCNADEGECDYKAKQVCTSQDGISFDVGSTQSCVREGEEMKRRRAKKLYHRRYQYEHLA